MTKVEITVHTTDHAEHEEPTLSQCDKARRILGHILHEHKIADIMYRNTALHPETFFYTVGENDLTKFEECVEQANEELADLDIELR